MMKDFMTIGETTIAVDSIQAVRIYRPCESVVLVFTGPGPEDSFQVYSGQEAEARDLFDKINKAIGAWRVR